MSTPTGTPQETKQNAAATYNSASDVYDHPANSFWDYFGQNTVERVNLKKGAQVLDVCCGSGASAIPAARLVGSDGFVVGSERAMEARKARRPGVDNLGGLDFSNPPVPHFGIPFGLCGRICTRLSIPGTEFLNLNHCGGCLMALGPKPSK